MATPKKNQRIPRRPGDRESPADREHTRRVKKEPPAVEPTPPDEGQDDTPEKE